METTVSLNVGSCPLQVEMVSREVDGAALTLTLYDQELSALSVWIKDQGSEATPPTPHLSRRDSHCIVPREESLLESRHHQPTSSSHSAQFLRRCHVPGMG